MSTSEKNFDLMLLGSEVRRLFPSMYGAYLFGSATTEHMRTDSDLDIAILDLEPLSPTAVLTLKGILSEKFRRDSDIVDLYRADSVTAAQIVTTGIEICSVTPLKMAEFETMAMSRYAILNEDRAEILEEINRTGRIYGG